MRSGKKVMTSISQTWGTTEAERKIAYPCDGLISDVEAAVYRGVTINASAPTIFRWLCQMRLAPYSYDLIDNFGKQSPQELIPGTEDLQIGQAMMEIFTLVGFERDRQVTIRMKKRSRASRTFGDIAVTYLIVPNAPDSCRLLVKLIAKYPGSLRGRLMSALLPWGDLIMMRRQLLNFKRLAEQTDGVHSLLRFRIKNH